MKKILCALFLTLLLSSCMQHYYVVRTEGTGIKAYNSESTDVYLTEPYKGNIVYLTEAYENIEKQGGKIYIQIRKTEKNIITIVVARQDVHKGSRHYWDPEYNKTFKLLDTPIITDNNGIKITVLKTVENLESKFDKGIYGKNVDIYLEKDVPEELAIDLGRVETKGKVYNTGKIYLKRE